MKAKKLRQIIFPMEMVRKTSPDGKRVSRGKLLRATTEHEWKDNGLNHRREQRYPSMVLGDCLRKYYQETKRGFA